MPPSRRRSPLWIRETPGSELHAIVGSFDRRRVSEDLSRKQEWLYDAVISELEYRRRNTRPIWSCCSCRYCVPPFSDGDADAESQLEVRP